MSGVDDTMVFMHAAVTLEDGTAYIPFIHPNGYVGFKCMDAAGRVEYLYLNPSDHTDGDVPNVFVYHGTKGDPAFDGSAHHYLVLQED